MNQLTEQQYYWVATRGGRTYEDVIKKNGSFFVLMIAGKGKTEMVEIPSDKCLNFYWNPAKRQILDKNKFLNC